MPSIPILQFLWGNASNDADDDANANEEINEDSAVKVATAADGDANADEDIQEGSADSVALEKKWYEDPTYKDAKHVIAPPPEWEDVEGFPRCIGNRSAEKFNLQRRQNLQA